MSLPMQITTAAKTSAGCGKGVEWGGRWLSDQADKEPTHSSYLAIKVLALHFHSFLWHHQMELCSTVISYRRGRRGGWVGEEGWVGGEEGWVGGQEGCVGGGGVGGEEGGVSGEEGGVSGGGGRDGWGRREGREEGWVAGRRDGWAGRRDGWVEEEGRVGGEEGRVGCEKKGFH